MDWRKNKYDFVALFSGGLDSSLAIKIMVNEGFKILAVKFHIPFERGHFNNEERFYFEKKLGSDLLIIPLIDEYLDMLKNPDHGYGSNFNPCIDCKILFFKKAKEIMKTVNAKGIISGEVLGQRPMSQKANTLRLIEKESKLEGLILRPLSAKQMKPTSLEKNGFVNREHLYNIYGRGRHNTIELSREFKFYDYETPAGGCLLTEPAFSRRLKETIEHNEYKFKNIESLKYGRHFRLNSGCKLIIGRNESENDYLCDFLNDWIHIHIYVVPGPVCFLSDYADFFDIEFSARICAQYSDFKGDYQIPVTIKGDRDNKTGYILYVNPASEEEFKKFQLL